MNDVKIKDPYLVPREKIGKNTDHAHLLEVSVRCPLCGKYLLKAKGNSKNKLYQIAHIYPNSPTEHQSFELIEPILNLEGNKYDFTTMDDTGTGTSYKSLIVYDMSILMLTELPILIHDSVVLKQISDIAIEKILELYMKANKQIFISFDKISAYTKKSQSYLQKSKVLELSVGGNELFGRSWNER